MLLLINLVSRLKNENDMFINLIGEKMNKIVSIALLLSITAGLQASLCDWPSVNHDNFNTRSNPCPGNLTPENVSGLTQVWNTLSNPNAFAVQAAPAVVGGYIYYGDVNGTIWKYDTAGNYQTSASFGAGNVIGGPVTVANGIIYFVTNNDLTLHAINASDLSNAAGFTPVVIDASYVGVAEVLSGAVVVDGLVIVGITNTSPQESIAYPPVVYGGFYAFDASSGAAVWQFQPNAAPLGTGGGSWSTAGVDTNLQLLFVGTSNATQPPAGPNTDALLAIDYTTGRLVWSQQYTANDVWSALYPCGYDYDLGASPNLFTICLDGKAVDVVGANSKQAVYRVFERKTGKPVWSTSVIPNGSVPALNGNSGAAYANDTVYAKANADHSGVPFNVLSMLGQIPPHGLPWIIGVVEGIYFTDVSTIRALDAKTGKVKWTNSQVGSAFGSITHANGVLYTADFRSLFRAIDAKTGNVLYQDYVVPGTPSVGVGILGAPITVAEGVIVIGVGIQSGAGGIAVYSL